MDEHTEENAENTFEEPIENKSPLEVAEDYINWGELEKAQEILNSVKEKSAKKFYLQSLIYKKKCWYNEQRKALKAALKEDPENSEYREELEALKEFSKTPEYRSAVRQKQMGEAGGVCAECCAEGCCVCICQGICEGLGNGC